MTKSWTLESLAKHTGALLKGNPNHGISSVADLASATSEDAAFLSNPRYAPYLEKSKAGVICVDPNAAIIEGKNFLVSENPSRTFQEIVELFVRDRKITGFLKIHPTAVIHEDAIIGKNVTIGPNTVVDAFAEIGDGTTLCASTYVGYHSKVGENCLLYPGSVVREYCSLFNRVILQPGAVIGSCGLGYTTDSSGVHTKLEQLGNVILEDDVEVGANTTVDRARFTSTIIKKGTKLDNLIQIAHNVELGENNIIAAQTGIAGSAKTGRNVWMGGQVGIVGHVEVSDFVMIATRGGVSKSIKAPGKYAGSPVVSLTEDNKTKVHLRKIEQYAQKIKELEKRLSELDSVVKLL